MAIAPSNKVLDAAKFIFEKKKEKPEISLSTLIDEASMRFDLTPLDTEALTHVLQENKDKA